jgi:Helicase conserved C-terminal domain
MSETQANQLKLETLFQYWNLNDTQRVARRFQRGTKVTNTAAARKVISDTLSKNLPEFIASLSLEEQHLLWQVRKAEGAVSGWNLVAFAAMAGWINADKETVYGYRELPAGARFLSSFVENGILIPNNTRINSWNPDSRYYGTPSSNDDLIGADHRILAAISEPAPLEFIGFELPELPLAKTPTRARIAPLLELREAHRVLQLEGRLPLTQDGAPHKGTLKRMQKNTVLLGEHLTVNLLALLSIGVLVTSTDRKHLEPSAKVWQEFCALSTRHQLELLSQVFLSLPSNTTTGSNIDDAVNNAAAGREALLLGVSNLKHPVSLDVFAKVMTERVLRHVTFERGFFVRNNTEERAALLHWARHQLGTNGVLSRLGMIHSSENADQTKVIAPGSWFVQAREELAREELARDVQTRDVQTRDVQTQAAIEAKADAKCWIVQANFEILVYLEQVPEPLPESLQAAEPVRLDAQTATYRLTRQSVYSALENGLNLEALLKELARHSIVPMPPSIERSLYDWANRRDRVTLTAGCNLIEYASRQARDAALELKPGSRGIGDLFLLGTPGKNTPRIGYAGTPSRTIHFYEDGSFDAPNTDLIARTLIESSSIPNPSLNTGQHRISPEGARKAGPALSQALEARAKNPIPSSIKTLLEIWTGASNAPNLETITVFQHDQAAQLLNHPELKDLFAGLLAPNLALVPNTKLPELRRALEHLSIKTGRNLKTASSIKAETINPTSSSETPGMQYQLDTRKMREIIERAIAAGDHLELLYSEERYKSSYYGYGEKVKGKQRRERLQPLRVYRQNSTPYLEAKVIESKLEVSTGKTGPGKTGPGKTGRGAREETNERTIRIGYIVGIAVEAAGEA